MAVLGNTAVPVPASQTAGAGADASAFDRKTLALIGTLSATYQAQISCDGGTTYHNEGTALTAAGTVEITKPCTHVRWNCTAYSSGTPTSVLLGVLSTAR